jgi:hypothetical protein
MFVFQWQKRRLQRSETLPLAKEENSSSEEIHAFGVGSVVGVGTQNFIY